MNDIEHYQEIVDVMNEYDEIVKDEHILCTLRDRLKSHIRLTTIFNDFRLPLNNIKNLSYGDIIHKVGPFAKIMYHNKDNKISWSDDDRQPENEWLYVISFYTGAYTFGIGQMEFYPEKTFNKFFNELKSYNPKYTDTMNHRLYFSYDNAAKVHEDFDKIFKKYKELVKDELYDFKVKKLRKEIEKLEGESI